MQKNRELFLDVTYFEDRQHGVKFFLQPFLGTKELGKNVSVSCDGFQFTKAFDAD